MTLAGLLPSNTAGPRRGLRWRHNTVMPAMTMSLSDTQVRACSAPTSSYPSWTSCSPLAETTGHGAHNSVCNEYVLLQTLAALRAIILMVLVTTNFLCILILVVSGSKGISDAATG